jgi:hypothetical protein
VAYELSASPKVALRFHLKMARMALSIGLAFHEDFGGFLGGGPRRAGQTNGDFSTV